MKIQIYFFLFLFILIGCNQKELIENRPDFHNYFESYQVEGSFLLYDFTKNKTIVYNEERNRMAFLPASTFKILNTLIGLETGIITGKDFIIPWDSVPRQIPSWNRDHTLPSAFKNSVVPWYQELARRIGPKQMINWVSKSDFGQMEITNENIDLFWLNGNSRISPFEQLDFQKRLVQNKLPFTLDHIETVKSIMIIEEAEDYIFRGKTGWAVMNNINIGWFVGYLENGSDIYAFVINVESNDDDPTLFSKSREEIVRKIFNQLSLMKRNSDNSK